MSGATQQQGVSAETLASISTPERVESCLTNCDAVYFLSFVDLADGPMVVDVPALGAPSRILGTIDDRATPHPTGYGYRRRPAPARHASRGRSAGTLKAGS